MDFLPGNSCGEWQYLGSGENAIPYQQVTVFNEMKWGDFPIENFIAACGKFSGPIALVWNSDEPMPLNGDIRLSTDIFIFDTTGKKFAQISGKDWSHSKIITMGWTLSERLFVLFEDGRLFLFSILGTQVAEIKLIEQAFTDIVTLGIATESGCIAYTRSGRLVYIQCDDDYPSVTELPSIPQGDGSSITSLCCIESRFTDSGEFCIIASCWNESIYAITPTQITDLNIKQCFCGRIQKMAVAPNGHYIACFTHEGFITIVPSSFDAKILEFNTHTRSIPTSLVWCGEDSLVGYWKGYNLLMISPFCEYLRFEYDQFEEPLFLVQEIDCLRIISRNKHEIIRSVLPAIYNVYMEGSESLGSLLRKNFNKFAQKTSDVEMKEGLSDLSMEQVLEGIEECSQAAVEELSTILQEELLRTVNYAQTFLPKEQQELIAYSLPTICQTLRILNTLHSADVGLFLTYEEYSFLKDRAVISRLLSRRHYYLAVKLCQFLKIPHDFVLVDWACEKVKSSTELPTAELCTLIREKLSGYDVNYHQIAWTAYQANRIDLACLLLQYERKISDRIPLLLLIHQEEQAAMEACLSHDQDLIQFVGIQLYNKFIANQIDEKLFRSILTTYPSVFQCISKYIDIEKKDEKEGFLKNFGKMEEYCSFILTKAFQTSDFTQRIGYIKDIQAQINQYVETHKELDFMAKMIGEYIKLLGFQKEIMGQLKERTCMNMSVEQLIRYCIQKSQLKQADRIRCVFKISDKKFWYIKIRALADADFWEVLQLFANEKKSPVGYVPFVEACISHHREDQAKFFLQKISDVKERLKYSLLCKTFEVALLDAVKLKDTKALALICEQCEDEEIRNTAEKSLQQLVSTN